MKKHPRYNTTLKVLKNGAEVSSIRTMKTRRILQFVQTDQTPEATYYLCVRYGRQKDNFGNTIPFQNEGHYRDKNHLLSAFRAFYEES